MSFNIYICVVTLLVFKETVVSEIDYVLLQWVNLFILTQIFKDIIRSLIRFKEINQLTRLICVVIGDFFLL